MKKQNLEEMTVAQLKDLIKESANAGEVEIPSGMWKMTKPKLIDFINENIVKEEEIVEEVTEDTTEETETGVPGAIVKVIEDESNVDNLPTKHITYDEVEKRRGGLKKRVRMTSEDEVIYFDKIDDAHKWLRSNHKLGYYHIKKCLEGTQSRKLKKINVMFERVED